MHLGLLFYKVVKGDQFLFSLMSLKRRSLAGPQSCKQRDARHKCSLDPGYVWQIKGAQRVESLA